jgi:hypothetical protein
MDMSGEHHIAAPRDKVWAALNDPEVLKACIAGAETVEKTSDTEFSAVVIAKVGPVKAKFKGKVTLSDIDAPNGYTISGEGQGGAAGFGKGGAEVKLVEDGDGTLLTYTANASVGGKLAQIGSRLVDSTAKKMAADFFTAFTAHVGGPVEEAASDAPAPTETAAAPAPASGGLPTWVWAGGLIVIVALVLWAYGGN